MFYSSTIIMGCVASVFFLIWGEKKNNQPAQTKTKKKQPEDFFQVKRKDLDSGSFTDSSPERAGESVKGVWVEVN